MSLIANDNDLLAPIAAKLSEMADLYEEIAELAAAVEADGRATLMAACEVAVGASTAATSSVQEQAS